MYDQTRPSADPYRAREVASGLPVLWCTAPRHTLWARRYRLSLLFHLLYPCE
ncbi:hypothetical protein J6590_082629 [Homalodisca vitripennis]|nr:hypothetical protein J6590_082629 [Homalodisca vitripennis]